jgi:hypothetical protein
MPQFRTTVEILNRDWDNSAKSEQAYSWSNLPRQIHWNKDRAPTIEDIETWEEIYYQCGSLGIYGAWSPYVELYVIVHCFYSKKDKGIEMYYGPNAGQQVKERAKLFGIDLPINKIWVDYDYKAQVIPILE